MEQKKKLYMETFCLGNNDANDEDDEYHAVT